MWSRIFRGHLNKMIDAIDAWLNGPGQTAIQDAGKSFGKSFIDAFGKFIHDQLPGILQGIADFLGRVNSAWTITVNAPVPGQDVRAPSSSPSATSADASGGSDPGGAVGQFASGGWLREPVVGVGPSGTRYMMHANEYISPSGALSQQAAASHAMGGGGGAVTLTVQSGAVQINTASADGWSEASDKLWDDLHAKLQRALANRAGGG